MKLSNIIVESIKDVKIADSEDSRDWTDSNDSDEPIKIKWKLI